MKVFAFSQKGTEHSENEDRIIIGKTVLCGGKYETEIDGGIIGVADGVGGQNAGAIASHFLASSLSVTDSIDKEYLYSLNTKLIEKSFEKEEYNNMASTLTIVDIAHTSVCYHTGNTRLYNLRNNRYLRQLTTDDTMVEFLVSSGQLSPNETSSFENRNQITACFGSGSSSYLTVSSKDITDVSSGTLIMTTDGIHDYVSLDDLENILVGYTPDIACQMVVEEALKNGSVDDKSIIIIQPT